MRSFFVLFALTFWAASAYAGPRGPYTQLLLSMLTSEPKALGGEMGAAFLFQPVKDRSWYVGPRLSVKGLSSSQGAIVGGQAGVESNLWFVNAVGPGVAVDFVGPTRLNQDWLKVGWRAEGYAQVRFKQYDQEGAWAARVGALYDSRFHWGIRVGVSLQLDGVQ